MAESSLSQLLMVEEVTWGTTPASALIDQHFNSESLKTTADILQSARIRSDRQGASPVRSDLNGGGDFTQELAYSASDDAMQQAFHNDYATAVSVTDTDIDFANGDNSVNQAAGDFGTDGFVAGMLISVTGSTANSRVWRVASVAATKMVLEGGTVVTEASGPSVTMKGQTLSHGTTAKSATIEKQFTDVAAADRFHIFRGARCSGFNFNSALAAIPTIDFSWLSKPLAIEGATSGTGGPTAAPTTDAMNTIDSGIVVIEGGGDITKVQAFTCRLDNNLRATGEFGTLGPVDVVLGTLRVEGTINVIFDDKTLIDKYINFTQSSLSVAFRGPSLNFHGITLPAVRYTDGQVLATGQNQTVLVELSYEAFRDSTLDKTITWEKMAA